MQLTAETEIARRKEVRQVPRGVASSLAYPAVENGDEASLLASHGRTFHFATRFMPAARRSQVVTLYAFFRTLDDLIDCPEPGRSVAQVRAELDAWRAWLDSDHRQLAPREPLGAHLAAILEEHRIPTSICHDFLRGLVMDLERREFEHFADLREYCYCVAGTVGLAMAHLLGARSAQALQAAEDLGIAMQLTNVLRDVGGDLRLGRVYLPTDELRAAGISREHLWALVTAGDGPDGAVRALLRAQVARAYGYYQRGMAGIWLLPEETRLPILIAARLYRAILTCIHRNHYDVLRRRAATTLPHKVSEAARALVLVSLWRRGERVPGGSVEVRYVD